MIDNSTKNIHNAGLFFYKYVEALNETATVDNATVKFYWDEFKRECSNKRCENSVRKLLATITQEQDYLTSSMCDILRLTYQKPIKSSLKSFQYPCYRDFMIMRAGAVLQSVI